MSNQLNIPSAEGLLLADSLRDDPFYTAIVSHLPDAERRTALALYMDASLAEAEVSRGAPDTLHVLFFPSSFKCCSVPCTSPRSDS